MNNYAELLDIQRAILAGLDYYKSVKLPKPQGAGTDTQKSTYAMLQAKKVQKEIYKS